MTHEEKDKSKVFNIIVLFWGRTESAKTGLERKYSENGERKGNRELIGEEEGTNTGPKSGLLYFPILSVELL